VLGQGTQDFVAGAGGQLSQPGDVGKLEGRKARRGGGFAGLVDEAVEARPWGADEQEPGRRKEIIRLVKRYLTHGLFPLLHADLQQATTSR
jgi:hypothetical protein